MRSEHHPAAPRCGVPTRAGAVRRPPVGYRDRGAMASGAADVTGYPVNVLPAPTRMVRVPGRDPPSGRLTVVQHAEAPPAEEPPQTDQHGPAPRGSGDR